MAYVGVTWEDSPSDATPVTAENLNIMNGGIKALDQELRSPTLVNNILKTGGISTSNSSMSDQTTYGQRKTFKIGPYGPGNEGQYCVCEYRWQSGTGNFIVQTTTSTFYICDIFDRGEGNFSATARPGCVTGYHAKVVGQYVPGHPTSPHRIYQISGSAIESGGSVGYNEYGTLELNYPDERNNRKALMYKAEIWTPSPQ